MFYTSSLINMQSESKRTTAQAIRDFEKVKLRVQNAGFHLNNVIRHLMAIFGPKLRVYNLLEQANMVSEMLGLTVDRLATRNRKALLCWYAENWSHICYYLPVKPTLMPAKKQNISQNIQAADIDISDISNLLNYH